MTLSRKKVGVFCFTGISKCETVKPWQFFVTFLGWLSDPFQWLNDLQLGDEKVTLNHLDPLFFFNVRDIKKTIYPDVHGSDRN